MADIKPCPFCGRTPLIEDCGTNRYFVRCKCGIAQDKLYAQRCDAIRRWNTRKYDRQVVLCKDCKHYKPPWHCEAWNNIPGFPAVNDEMSCSMAERKTDE